jgi:hypothetical protein
MKGLPNIMIATPTLLLSGFMMYLNFTEWYNVKIMSRTSGYPFGGEGPVPYYYETPAQYSTVCFVTGLAFLAPFFSSGWALIKCNYRISRISCVGTILLLICFFLHG